MSNWTQPQLIARLQQSDVSALDDATAASTINADYRTAPAIPLLPLKQWCHDNGLQSRLSRTVQSAAFSAVCGAQTPPLNVQQTADSINDGMSYIVTGVDGQTLNTLDPSRAQKTYNMLSLMVGVNGQDATLGMTSAEMAAFLAFGGGIIFGPNSVTAAQVTTARQAIANGNTALQRRRDLASWYNTQQANVDAWENGGYVGAIPAVTAYNGS